jgi:putative nucleotidyltransferase with HDIG domain
MNATGNIDFTLDYVFETLSELPVFPKVVQKAMAMLDDPDISIRELAKTLKFDQALTANILKITNSAHFGLAQRVSDLETALPLLGQHQIRQVLMASAAVPYLTRSMDGYCMNASDLWAHSICCAVISELLADKCNFSSPPALFTSALLHDIGKIVMELYIGPRLKEAILLVNRENITFCEAEWRVIGGDHAIIGSEILNYWDFPADIVRAVRNHHDPDLYIQDELSALLALSNILTVELGIGVGADAFRFRISPELAEISGVSEQDIYEILILGIEKFREASDMMEMYNED